MPVTDKIREDVSALDEFANEVKWVERGKSGWKGQGEPAENTRDRALQALNRLKSEPKMKGFVAKYKITLPNDADIIKNYRE